MLKDKFVAFVKNPKTIDFAKTFATTVVTIVVLNVVVTVVNKGVEYGMDKLLGNDSETETPAE